MKLTQKQKDEIWWMIISVDYNYSRISIADHELTDEVLTLWLEDKHDYKNSLDECFQLDIPARQFAKVIRAENMNSYDGTRLHDTKHFVYQARIEINSPIKWYKHDATSTEQCWAREAMLKSILTQLVETETAGQKFD